MLTTETSLPHCLSLTLWPQRHICPHQFCPRTGTAFCRFPVDKQTNMHVYLLIFFLTELRGTFFFFICVFFSYNQSCLFSTQVRCWAFLCHVSFFGRFNIFSFLLQPASSNLQHQTLQEGKLTLSLFFL